MKTSRALAPVACAALFFSAPGAHTCRAQQQTFVVNQATAPSPPAARQSQSASTVNAQASNAQVSNAQAAQTSGATPAPSQTTQTDGAQTATAAARAGDAGQAKRAADSITGRVLGEGGEPLGGVTVYAAPRSYSPAPFRTPYMALADDDGGFRIRGLEPGIYSLNVFVPGYVPETDPVTGRTSGEYKPGDTATVRLVKGGVITGAVTDAEGQPIVALGVRAFRVRDLDGHATPLSSTYVGTGKTDDRGVYRVYGLLPGVYVVVAGGLLSSTFGVVTPYQTDAPTFYPSSTRDTAVEVAVRAGQESAGVDIRYREEQGHRVTGKVVQSAPAPEPNVSTGLSLSYASSGLTAGVAYVNPLAPDPSFSFEGIPDGDYDLQATGGGREGLLSAAAPQRVTVRGADITGLRVALAPLASASGTVVVERANEAARASAECKDAPAPPPPQETLVTAISDRPASAKAQPIQRISPARDATPDAAGAFTLRALEAGRYRLLVRPFDESLYVRSIELPNTASNATTPAPRAAIPTTPARPSAAAQSASTRTPATTATEVLDIRAGRQTGGITVHLAKGAAGLSGHVVAAEGAAPPPFASLRVHLLPAEREHSEDALRFFETSTSADGTFSFKNLPPGRYLLLARVIADTSDATPRPASWDAASRARLRAEAEAANTTIELQPCQRTTDFTLRFPPK